MWITYYYWWQLVNDISKTLKDLASQYDPNREPKYMKPDFDFYKSNWIKADSQAINELEHRLRNYITKIIRFFEDNVFKIFIRHLKDYEMVWIDRKKQLKERNLSFMTNEMQPIVRTFVDRLHNNSIDSSVNTKIYPMDELDNEIVEKMQKFIDSSFSSSKAKETISESWFDWILHWLWYWRTWFKPLTQYFKDKAEDEKADEKEYRLKEVHAMMDYVPRYCLFADPTKDFYNNPIVYRNWVSAKNAAKRLEDFTVLTEEHWTVILKNPQRFSNSDYSKAKLIRYYDHCELDLEQYNEGDIYKVREDNDEIEYVEYRDWENLVILLNWYIVFDWENPLWDHHPFKVISSWKMSWVRLKSGIGDTLGWIQKMYNTYYNIVFDLAKFTAWPMWYIEGNLQIEWNKREDKLDWNPFDIKKVYGDWEIKMFPMPKPDEVNFKMLSEMLEMANFVVDPASYNQLKSQSRSAADSHYRYEELKNSVKSLMESFNKAMTRTIKDWFILAQNNLPPKFKFPFRNDSDNNIERNTLDVDKLKSNMLFETEFDSIANINRILERSQIMEFVQNSRILWEDPITQKYLLNNKEIIKVLSYLYNQPWKFGLTDEQYKELVIKAERLKKSIWQELEKLWLTVQQEWQEQMQPWQEPWNSMAWSDVAQTVPTDPLKNLTNEQDLEIFL